EGCVAGPRAPELRRDLGCQRLNAAILDLVEAGFFRHVPIDQPLTFEPGVAALKFFQQLLDGTRPIMVDPQFVAEMRFIVPPHAELMRIVDRTDQAWVGNGFRAAQLLSPSDVRIEDPAAGSRPVAG